MYVPVNVEKFVDKAQGRASFAIDNKMIDIPVVERAERILKRAHAVAAREAKKAAALA